MWHTQMDLQRAAGLPASEAEVDALYPPIPDERNGAATLLAATDAFRPMEAGWSFGMSALRMRAVFSHPNSEGQARAWREFIVQNEEAWNLLREADGFPDCRFALNRHALVAGQAQRICSKLAKLHDVPVAAMALAIYEGTPDAFVESARLALAISRSLEDLPILFVEMSRRELVDRVVTAIERAMEEGILEDRHLEALGEMLARIPARSLLRAALGAELFSILDAGRSKSLARTLARLHVDRYITTRLPWKLPKFITRGTRYGLTAIYRAAGLSYGSSAVLASTARTSMESFDLPLRKVPAYLESEVNTGSLIANVYGVNDLYSSSVFTPNDYVEDDYRRAGLRLNIAVARYRGAYGSTPENLDELVPEFLDALPNNPKSLLPIGMNHVRLDENVVAN